VVHKDHDEAAEAPTPGYLPFAPPSDVITLYDGPLQLKVDGGLSGERPGKIALAIRSGSHLLWGADLDEATYEDRRKWRLQPSRSQTSLRLSFHGTVLDLDTDLSGDGAGFFGRPSTSGPDSTPLVDVIAHWVNLPSLPRGELLCLENTDGSWMEWGGRWVLALGAWEAIIDGRPDLAATLRDAKRERLYAVTHTMRLRRRDGRTFPAQDAQSIRWGLQLAFSFALGRWAAPVLAVGRDAAGRVTWTEWSPLHVDSPAKAQGRWWAESRPEDLREFLALFINRWRDPAQQPSLRFLTTSAIAAGESGFVEQRLMTALAALEHLHWITYRRDDGSAHQRLRRLLSAASVDLDVVQEDQTVLARFAAGSDGPQTLVQIRNALTHPKEPQEVYKHNGLLGEASRLASRYLDLALLHHVGYNGNVTDRTKITGWSGENRPVPWAPRDEPSGDTPD
jgi:hypothetical protein